MRALIPLVCLLLISCHARPDQPRHRDGAMALYTVSYGDCLEWIAWDFDVPGGYPALAKLNGLKDPDVITMGQRLRIPRTGIATEDLPPWPSMEPVKDAPRSCDVERLEPPRVTQVPGCASSACVTLEGGRQMVCSCQATQGSPGFVLVEAGRPVMAWPAPVQGQRGNNPAEVRGTARDFDVVKADLDGDGRREHLVAFRREANDVGMSWWNLAVLSGSQPHVQPLLFTAANYGEGSLIDSRSSRGCDLLTTTWELAWEPGPLNQGWTLLGRPMGYQQGALTPLPQRPIFARRLYYSFEPGAMPLPGGLVVGTPANDLGHRNAHQRVVEPAAQYWRQGDNAVTITAAQPSLDPELGVVSTLNLDNNGYQWQLEWKAWNQGYDALGDQATGRLYPPGYRPADPGWLTNRSATVTAYARLYGDNQQLVWLTP